MSEEKQETEFRGAWTALVTPFRPDGAVDEEALRRFVRFQVEQGIDGLVACGTTGESATLTADEQARVVSLVVEAAKSKASTEPRVRMVPSAPEIVRAS